MRSHFKEMSGHREVTLSIKKNEGKFQEKKKLNLHISYAPSR